MGNEWIDSEILDNPTGEVSEEEIAERQLAEEAEVEAEGVEASPEASEAAPEEGVEAEAPSVEGVSKQRDGILKELRETRDELKRERMENAERNRVLEERLGKLFEAKEAAPEVPAPDPEEDPLGHLSFQQKQIADQQRQFLEQQQQQQQAVAQQQQLQQVAQTIGGMEKQFRDTSGVDEDTYEAALGHARKEVSDYYKAMGFPADEAEKIAQVEQMQFAAQAIQRGVNPAEARYNLALSRGFKSPSVEPAEPGGEGETPATAREALAKTLEFKKGAVESSKSLGTTSGTQGKRRITLEDLANAPAELFDKVSKDPALWERLNVEGSLLI